MNSPHATTADRRLAPVAGYAAEPLETILQNLCSLGVPALHKMPQEPCSDSEYRQPVGIQDAIDWGVFAAKFTARHGSIPRRDDPHHSEYFHWFTVGAHEEFMGRLNP